MHCDSSRVTISRGGGEFSRFQVTGDDRRIFDGFEISIPGFLGGEGKFGKFPYFGGLI